MAFECPNCKEKTLSTRFAEVKICLNCNRIVDKEELLKLLKKLGISDKTIECVDSELDAVILASALHPRN